MQSLTVNQPLFLRGADIVAECLIEQGADTVFGYPGGQIIDVFDALYLYRDRIKQVLTSHEQGASHAADAYARVTGKVGVVIATSGPGATNLVTGIANAYMDSVPMVAITGNVPVASLGRDSFQEVDIAGITMPITKHNYIVKDITKLAETLREAFYIAKSGRPGPVLIDIPKNIQQQKCEFTSAAVRPLTHKPIQEDENTLEAIQRISRAKRPLIYAGGGCNIADADKELIAFAEKLHAPVSLSMMGLGAFPASHPLFLGMIGMHGSAGVAKALGECDLVIAIGARFSDRVAADRLGFCKHADIVHFDIDHAEIGKNVAASAHIVGDVKLSLAYATQHVTPHTDAEWIQRCIQIRLSNDVVRSGQKLCPHKILETISNLTPDDQLVATDVGQHQMFTAQTYKFEKPHTFITSGGLGTMGFGLGAAIGASMGANKSVVLISGDGSLHMNLNELATAVRYRLPIILFLFNNNTLGMVRQWQTLFYDRHYSSTTLNLPTNYELLTKAFGLDYLALTRNEDVEAVVKQALGYKTPVLVECAISADEFVLPMIPPGKGYESIITDLKNKTEDKQ